MNSTTQKTETRTTYTPRVFHLPTYPLPESILKDIFKPVEQQNSNLIKGCIK